MTGIELGRDESRVATLTDAGPRVVATGKPVLPTDAAASPDPDATTDGLRPLVRRLTDGSGPVVIAVPAWFHDGQRRVVLDAAGAAGLAQARLVNEPSAAAAWVHHATGESGRTLVVQVNRTFLDVTVVASQQQNFEVLATDGASLEDTTEDLVPSTALKSARSAVRNAEIRESDLASVLVLGSHPSRDATMRLISDQLGLAATELDDHQEAVALGAALFGSLVPAPEEPPSTVPAAARAGGGCVLLLAVIGGLISGLIVRL